MTPSEATFVQRIYCFRRDGYHGIRSQSERVEVTSAHIAIIDTHPAQPGKVLFDIARHPDGRLGAMRWESALYPYLDLHGHRLRVERAVKNLIRARKRALTMKGATA